MSCCLDMTLGKEAGQSFTTGKRDLEITQNNVLYSVLKSAL